MPDMPSRGIFLSYFFFVFGSLGLHLRHMEVPRPGVQSALASLHHSQKPLASSLSCLVYLFLDQPLRPEG